MKITKYPQSCLLIESQNKKILIDPGNLSYENSFLNEWKDVDLILITHRHPDHCYEAIIKKTIENEKSRIYSTSEVKKKYPNLPMNIVKQGDIIKFKEFTIEVVKAVHWSLLHINKASHIEENIGFILNLEDKRIYITSDTVPFKNNHKCDVIFLPISDSGLMMKPHEAIEFIRKTEAKLAIPIHMDNPNYPVNLKILKRDLKKEKLNYKLLEIKENLKI